MSLHRLVAAFSAALALTAAVPAGAGTIVEYYHKGLDHYFVTGLAAEVQALDSGKFAGWARTGFSFQTYEPTDAGYANALPVCRFYGNPARGLDSHFYSSSAAECEAVKSKWPESWQLETMDLFRVHAVNPQTGLCPAGTKAVYRLYNKRADVNHRYTTDAATVDAMITKGYVLEGDGNPQRPVAFCAANVAPALPAAGSPACTIKPDAEFAVVGQPVTLTATCTNTPTTFAWSNCAGKGNTCVATATAVGKVQYSLVATNAIGPSAPVTETLDWQVAAGAAPSCAISSSAASVALGGSLTLTANCSQQPSQFQWMGCSALLIEACNFLSECSTTSSTCSPAGKQAGSVYYALIAKNSAGSSPKTGIMVEWTGGATGGGGSGGGGSPPPSPTSTCTITPSSTSPAVGTTLTLTASCTNNPVAFLWSGCNSTSSTCTTTESTPVTRNYSVYAQNAAGYGFPTQVAVTWQSPATAPPVCTVSASTSTPYAGGSVTLSANCTQSPTAFQWTNCSSTTSTCTATSASAGPLTYAVTASNQFGASAPASTTLTWAPSAPPGTNYCGQYNDVLYVDLPWGGTLDTQPNGGMRANAVVVARMTVPQNARTGSGQVRFVEYIDPQAPRQMTVSTSACDFRGFAPGGMSRSDPTSASAPMMWSNGINPMIIFNVNGPTPTFQPGQTYYFNLRNVDWVSGQPSCGTNNCNGRFQISAP